MHKLLIMNQFKQQEIVELPGIPRVGDTIPLFFTPAPKVQIVCWMPEELLPELNGSGIEAVITVE